MQLTKAFIAAAAAAMLITPLSANAASRDTDQQIRKLDIMLMVTSLRCRFGADNFQSDYQRFSASHLTALNASARRLEAGLAANHGAKGAKRALDKISVAMANQYGQGHPWLGCSDLKKITRNLASTRDPMVLAQAAKDLLGPPPQSGALAVLR